MNRIHAKLCTMIVLLMLIVSCAYQRGYSTFSRTDEDICRVAMPEYNPTAMEIEKDNIFSLLAYAVVFKDWQKSCERDKSRGYNIGSVLVDEQDNIVCWARNAVNITNNNTQHGEVRLMYNYIHNSPEVFSLPKYKLYTTLEPCAMCSGMMTLNKVYLTVYGQKDHSYGDALERLELDSESCGGFKPYPRPVISVINQTDIPEKLDAAYINSGIRSITEWLATAQAKDIFSYAYQKLYKYDPKYPENKEILQSALDFLKDVPDEFAGFLYKVNCP